MEARSWSRRIGKIVEKRDIPAVGLRPVHFAACQCSRFVLQTIPTMLAVTGKASGRRGGS
jgi:hypothetical protein